jgi:hypothetical protein
MARAFPHFLVFTSLLSAECTKGTSATTPLQLGIWSPSESTAISTCLDSSQPHDRSECTATLPDGFIETLVGTHGGIAKLARYWLVDEFDVDSILAIHKTRLDKQFRFVPQAKSGLAVWSDSMWELALIPPGWLTVDSTTPVWKRPPHRHVILFVWWKGHPPVP